MAVSSFSVSTLIPSPPTLSSSSSSSKPRTLYGTLPPAGLVVECSSRPQKKATKHHMKTRPKKTQPWDIRRRPTVYPPFPPLPPDWTLVESSGVGAEPPAIIASSTGAAEEE